MSVWSENTAVDKKKKEAYEITVHTKVKDYPKPDKFYKKIAVYTSKEFDR